MILIGLCAAIPGMIMPGRCGVISSAATWSCIFLTHQRTASRRRQNAVLRIQPVAILLPLVLVGLKTIAARFVPEVLPLTNGSSLLVIRLPRFWCLPGGDLRSGNASGYAKRQRMEICGHALQPAGIILLVIGGAACSNRCWLTLVSVRHWAKVNRHGPADCHNLLRAGSCSAIIQGSATVACLTAVGLVMPALNN